jgi:hypothetical protein
MRGFKTGNTGNMVQATSSSTKANNDDTDDKRGIKSSNTGDTGQATSSSTKTNNDDKDISYPSL